MRFSRRFLPVLAAGLFLVLLPLGGGALGATSSGANGDIVFAKGADLYLLSTENVVEALASQPSWSPDGTKLAFVQAGSIKTCTVSSGSCTSVSGALATGTEPAWSPDGTKIAYVTLTNEIHTIAAGGGSDTAVATGATDASPSWSPDGSQIVFTQNGAIAKVSSSGGTPTSITTTGVSGSTQPAWSPDGSTIAFQSGSPTQIYVVTASGGSVTQVTNTAETETAPSWSPDGTSIVYAQTSGSNAIYKVVQGVGGAWGTPQPLDTSSGDATPDWQTVAPIAVSAPTISGGFAPQTGQLLSATTGSWQGASSTGFTYVWQRCDGSGGSCSAIGGATTSSYGVVSADVGHTLRVVVTASNAAGSTASSPSSATGIVTLAGVVNPPLNTAYPTIKLPIGETVPQVGDSLTATVGTWAGSFPMTFTYQWKKCDGGDPLNGQCFSIDGATSSFFVVPASLYGMRIRVAVTAANSAASVTQNSEASAIVSAAAPHLTLTPPITGTLMVGQTLSVGTGTWTGSQPITFTYQWKRCNPQGDLPTCVTIVGATQNTYVPTVADIGFSLIAFITGTNPAGSITWPTIHTYPIVDKPHFAPTAATQPAISGLAVVGGQLTATIATFNGDTPIATTMQWQRCDATGSSCHTIASATKTTYTPTLVDIGSTLRLAIAAKNAYGSIVALSGTTSPVLGMPPHVRGRRIVGTAKLHYLLGTPYDDVIVGGPGNETIDGAGGYDTIRAGSGNDVIFVRGPGNSRVFGGSGSSTIYVANGYKDTVTCTGSRDKVVADAFDVVKGCKVVTISGSSTGSGSSSPGSGSGP